MSERRFKIDIGASPFDGGVVRFFVYERQEVRRWFGKPKVRWLWRYTASSLGDAQWWVEQALKLPLYLPEVE